MDTATAAIIGIVTGALFSGLGKAVWAAITLAQERKGIAAAIAGEISGLIYGAEMSKQAENFEALAKLLRSPPPPAPPWNYVDPAYVPDPVLNAYISRIGTLGGDLPQRIAHFYTLLAHIRLRSKMMASGLWDKDPDEAAAAIDEALAVWRIAVADGKKLVADLQSFSGIAP